MTKRLIFSVILLTMFFVGGCGIFASHYRETREYDLAPVASNADGKLPQVRFGVFRNFSGAGLPLLFREEGSRVRTDVYNRWLMSPELMFERELRRALGPADESGKAGCYVRLSGTLFKFEIDAVRSRAVLEVEFSAAFYRDRVLQRTENAASTFETPLKNDSIEAASEAMSHCVGEAAAFAAKLVKKAVESGAEEKLSEKSVSFRTPISFIRNVQVCFVFLHSQTIKRT